MNMRLFQAFVLFGFYVVMTAVNAPDGARAGFLTASCIALIAQVVYTIKCSARSYRKMKNKL